MKGMALLVWIALAGVAGVALFTISYRVEKLEEELTTLNRQVLKEQKAMHVLQAEWGYLNRPSRIEALSRKVLPRLQPPAARQIGDFDGLAAAARGVAPPGVPPAVADVRPAVARGRR